jgi:large subunit ribosomal protein L15
VRANELPPVPGSTHKKKRVGRGNSSGHGTSAGRGTKGQQSRAGYSKRLGFEGGQNPLIRALSRKRGFHNRFRVEYEPINLSDLAKFEAGASLTTASLREAGIVKSARKPVKILGGGELGVALTIEAERFSATARQKIEAAGGTVIELSPRAQEEAAEDNEAPEDEAPAPKAAAEEESEA